MRKRCEVHVSERRQVVFSYYVEKNPQRFSFVAVTLPKRRRATGEKTFWRPMKEPRQVAQGT
jgi:hypothetical protein